MTMVGQAEERLTRIEDWQMEVTDRLARMEAQMVTKDDLMALSNEIASLQGTLEGVAWIVGIGLVVMTVIVGIVALPRVQIWWTNKRAAAHEDARYRLTEKRLWTKEPSTRT